MASKEVAGVGIGISGPSSSVGITGRAPGNGFLFLGGSESSSSGGWNSFLSAGVMDCGRSLTSPRNSEGTTAAPLVIWTFEGSGWAAGSCSKTAPPTSKAMAIAVRLRNNFRFDKERYIIFMFRFLYWRGGLGVFIRESPVSL